MCINAGVDMHLITQKLKAYVPLSQSCPVQPVVHEQVFGAMQYPPFWHGELQTAVIQSNIFSNGSQNYTLLLYIVLLTNLAAFSCPF